MRSFNFSLSFIFFNIGCGLGFLIIKTIVFQSPWGAFWATLVLCYILGSIGWLIGRRIDPPGQVKIIAINPKLLLLIPVFLIILVFFYQFIRYEKDTFGPLDLKYDRFQGKTYILNTRNPNAKWQPTGAENMRTLKYYLEKRELQNTIEGALGR